MKVSIVIPVFNRAELTRACLASLQKTLPQDLETEIVVVDNASTDDTPGLLEEHSRTDARLRVVRNEANLGFAAACNQGASASRGELLLFLNNDTEAHPGWLEPLVRTLESDESIGVVGSKLLYPDGTVQHAGVVLLAHNPGELLYFGHLYAGDPADAPWVNREREFPVVTAACALFRRDVFERLNGFDEGFRNSCEDIDLCLRVREAGYRVVYQPQSVLTHHESQTPGRRDHDRANLQRLFEKWNGKIESDEAARLREDGRMELADLVSNLAALRGLISQFHEIPDLFPDDARDAWRVRQRSLAARLARKMPWSAGLEESRRALLHQYGALHAATRLLGRLEARS